MNFIKLVLKAMIIRWIFPEWLQQIQEQQEQPEPAPVAQQQDDEEPPDDDDLYNIPDIPDSIWEAIGNGIPLLQLRENITITYPTELDIEDARADWILDPEKAIETLIDLLRQLKISVEEGEAPLDAWMRVTREMSSNPNLTVEDLLGNEHISPRAKEWIRFLQGVE